MRNKRQAGSVLVTGASRGLGEAFCQSWPEETRLVLTARSVDDLERVASDLRTRGHEVVVEAADLATGEGRTRVASVAEDAQVDHVVLNAGLGPYGRFVDVALEDHLAAIAVNNAATVALAHKLLPGMVERASASGSRAGLIVVASSAAFAPVPKFSVYAASKAFLLTWTEALCAEHADDPIDIMAFCPGAIRTEFGRRSGFEGGEVPGAMSPEFAARTACARLGRERTLVLDPVAGAPLSAVALGRAAFAQGVNRLLRRAG